MQTHVEQRSNFVDEQTYYTSPSKVAYREASKGFASPSKPPAPSKPSQGAAPPAPSKSSWTSKFSVFKK